MGEYVRGVSIKGGGQPTPLAQGLSGDDEGNHLTLKVPPVAGWQRMVGTKFEIKFANGNVRIMTLRNIDRGGVATFSR